MNRLTIIGNLTRDPELRTTQTGVNVCTFTVAVNRRLKTHDKEPEADFFRVTAWRELGEVCGKWLINGRKVAVVGSVSVTTYTGQDGKNHANLEVLAQDVEFLSPAGEKPQEGPSAQTDKQSGMQQVEPEELPF